MSAEKYIAKMKTIASELAAAGKPLDDEELIWSILHGLDGAYNNLKTAIRANPNTTLTDLYSQLQAFDQMNQPSDNEVFLSSANVARRSATEPPPRDRMSNRRPDDTDEGWRRDDRPRQYDERPRQYDERPRQYDDRSRRDGRYDDRSRRQEDGGRRDDGGRRRRNTPYVNVTCQICKIHGHPASDCWWRFQGDRDRRDRGADGDRRNFADPAEKGANVASYGVDTNWYTDSGATNHITSDLSKLTTQEKYTGRDHVHTAGGNGMQISHTGHSSLCTPHNIFISKIFCMFLVHLKICFQFINLHLIMTSLLSTILSSS